MEDAKDCLLVQEMVAQYDYLISQDRRNGGKRALTFLAKALDHLLDDVDFEKFIITKTYTTDNGPHAAVVLDMRKNGALVCKGDEIQYVYACIRYKRPGYVKAKRAQEASLVRNSGGRYIVDVEPYIDAIQHQCLYQVDESTKLFAETRSKIERMDANFADITKFFEAGIPEKVNKRIRTSLTRNERGHLNSRK